MTTLDGAALEWAEQRAEKNRQISRVRHRQRKEATRSFTDFFAGIGGFHVALARLGHTCVLACEVDQNLREVYEQNFGITPVGDIRHLAAADVPEHSIFCAGFPCQPFSLAGKLQGAECAKYGKLIDHAFRIIEAHRPEFVMLENVPNLLAIEEGRFWSRINRKFSRLGYAVDQRIYSPEQFGIPQKRNRLFVVASRSGLAHFCWPEPIASNVKSLSEYVIHSVEDVRCIEAEKTRVLNIWNQLIARVDYIRSDSVLAAEFGATYPFDKHPTTFPNWRTFKGAFGVSLANCQTWGEAVPLLPHYAKAGKHGVAEWLKPSIEYSRQLYRKDKKFFDQWKLDLIDLPNSWQKLEWRGDRRFKDIWRQTIQFRASGIRTMRPDFAPSLVAMTPTQTPIIGPLRRYMMTREAAALQSLEQLRVFPSNNERAFRALGNAVNALIVEKIAAQLIV